MAKYVDQETGGSTGRSIYRRLYVPLSHFTVHAGGGSLLRHVRASGKLSHRPSRAWTRRSPARVADAATGLLAAALANAQGKPHEDFTAYADRHTNRALVPLVVIAVAGAGTSIKPAQAMRSVRAVVRLYSYLRSEEAVAADSVSRQARIKHFFTEALGWADSDDIPAGALEPLIDYTASRLAHQINAYD